MAMNRTQILNTTTCLSAADAYASAEFELSPRDQRSRDVAAISPARSLAEFYAYALMEGAQATAAFEELSELLETRGEHGIAGLFRQCADTAADRTGALERRIGSQSLPRMSWWHHHWFYSAPPGPAARKLVAHLMTPHAALCIALSAMNRAMELYEGLSTTSSDAQVQANARELAADRARYVRHLRDALAAVPAALSARDGIHELGLPV